MKLISLILFAVSLPMGDLISRAGLSLLGAVAAYMAVMLDPPSTRRETAMRCAVGVGACFFFAPMLITTYSGFQTDEGWIPAFGIVGLSSWYLLGAAVKGLMWAKKSNIAEDLARVKLGLPKRPEAIPEPTPEVKVP